MRPARQSAFACAMRSREDDTKFHSTKRSPTGSPPRSMTIAGSRAVKSTGSPGANTSICPVVVAAAVDLDRAGGDIGGTLGVFAPAVAAVAPASSRQCT